MRRRVACIVVIGIIAAAAVVCSIAMYDFLAIATSRVRADILVVEGWVENDALEAASAEFAQGGYAYLLVSGMQTEDEIADPGVPTMAAKAASLMAASGVDRSRIIACPSPPASWNRTSGSARAVREKLRAMGIAPAGINVLTVGVHARQTRLAYRRIMAGVAPVGIITIAKKDFVPSQWWASPHGVRMVSKCLAGWVRELLFGLRS